MKKVVFLQLVFFGAILSISSIGSASIPNAPHSEISCADCHSDPLPDTDRSAICETCHNGVAALLARTHSNAVIHGTQNPPYAGLTFECLDCHDPHFQYQLVNPADPSLYLVTGEIIDYFDNLNGTSTFVFDYSSATINNSSWELPPYGTANWSAKSGAGRGLILVADKDKPEETFEIVSATIGSPDEIVVNGVMASYPEPETFFGIIYGQYLRDTVDTGTEAPVEFYDQTGTKSFADGDGVYDGICEVCHTQTSHFLNNGLGSDQNHNNLDPVNGLAGTNCTDVCHTHASGFGLGGGASCGTCHDEWGSHPIHTEALYGPNLSCDDCHNTTSYPLLADDQNLANTTVCDACHSPGGSYDGVNDPAIGVKQNNNWITGVYDGSMNLQTGKEKWCAGCHDEEPSEIQGVSAPNIVGDELSAPGAGKYGYYTTGHKVSCLLCHDATMIHTDGESRTYTAAANNYQTGYRLKSIDGQRPLDIPRSGGMSAGQFRLCFSCHDCTPFLVKENTDTNFRSNVDDACTTLDPAVDNVNKHNFHLVSGVVDVWDSDWDGAKGDSRMSCPACHNVHGAKPKAGASNAPAMIRTGELIGRPDDALNLDYFINSCSDQTFSATNETASSTGGMLKWQGIGAGTIAKNGVCGMCHNENEPYWRPAVGITGCVNCHANPLGSRRQITGVSGDFQLTSHHVDGVATDDDCLACHDQAYHTTLTCPEVYLKDADGGPSYTYDGTPGSLEDFCLNCHDSDGASAGGGTTPFSDGRMVPNVKGVAGGMWANSAHNLIGYAENGGDPITCFGDGSTTGCHNNAHGSQSVKLLAGTGGAPVTVHDFCYQCHTEGKVMNDAISNNRPGGYVLADDIQEAFGKSEKHDLGAAIPIGDGFTLECTSCHNPHLGTGKYWDAANGVSPVVRPDFSDPVNNPRAMGTVLWGDEAGEKMDDFAAQGSGTGGFYYKTAEGSSLGDTGLSFNQPAMYRPPKQGSGYNSEFSGDILPDYTSLCLDCHSSRMSGANPPINWGQGIGCTDNGVDPPSQRVECGADHGLAAAGRPWYNSDSGTPGNWGSSGNPDVIFDMNYVTRGRNTGHFMRWPYDAAERGAGINFVLACTDCHEAHGSNRGSIIRDRFNVNDSGACGSGSSSGENCSDGGNWNSYCNACHYYYGGQHAGMSCGNASCHEANSLHRIIHTTDSGAPTKLTVTAAGYENDFQRPDFTPEIETVLAQLGSNELEVTFRSSQYGAGPAGIFTNDDLTGALQPDDFWLFDKNGNNPGRTVAGVTHTAGETTATITLSEPVVLADLDTDTLAIRPASIWGYYEGGYNNWATGVIPAHNVSAGPWPVAITIPSINLTKVEGLASYDELYVEFSQAAYANSGGTGDLQPADFVLTDTDNGRTITAVAHTAGGSSAVLTLSSALDVSDDVGFDTLAAAVDSIYAQSGIAAGTDTVIVTAMPSPSISTVEGAVGSTKLMITFSDSVYTDKGMTGALLPSDFILTDTDNNRTISSIEHVPGGLTAIINLSSDMDATDDFLVDTIASVAGAVFGEIDYPVGTTPVAISEQPAPQIVAVAGQVDYDKLEVRFNTAVYADTGMTGSLQPSDFILTDSDDGRTITAVDHTPGVESYFIGEDIAWLTLSAPLDSTDDIDLDTVASNGIYNFLDAPVDVAPVTITDMPATVISAVEGSVGSNKLKVTFSHWVFGDTGKAGVLQPEDFVLTDVGSDNPRTIVVVDHGVGDASALLTMNEVLAAADVGADTIGAAAASIYNSADHPVPTTALAISATAAPVITSVEGTVGLDKLLVFFSEAVYTDSGPSGALQASDFVLTDTDNSRTIIGVEHTAGSASAILTLSSVLDGTDDIGADTLAAADTAIYNRMDITVETDTATISSNNCPVGGSRFDFNEGSGSAMVTDDTTLLAGTVGNPTYSMLGEGLYTGDETEAELTYIDLDNEDQCLKSPRALTLETRVYFGNVDLDYVDTAPTNGIDDDYDAGLPTGNECCSKDGDGRNTTATRIAERLDAWQFTVFRGNWSSTDAFVPDRARIIFKYRVTDRGVCDGNYPGDPTGEDTPVDGAWFKQISSDIESYPIVKGHWYKIRIVYNTDKHRLVVDIFADDQGTDGNGAGELWSGYKNVSRPDPEDSSACQWAAIPGLIMDTQNNPASIGDNTVHTRPGQDDQGDYRNTTLKGKLDWFSWKPIVDYSGVDDLPY